MVSVHRLPVSQLPPEHAERKRTQDRMNQRHSRARRKSEIESLKAANKVLKEKLAAVEAELACFRQREEALRQILVQDHGTIASNEQSPLEDVSEKRSISDSPGEVVPMTSPSDAATSISQDLTRIAPDNQSSHGDDVTTGSAMSTGFPYHLPGESEINLLGTGDYQLDGMQLWNSTYDFFPQLNLFEAHQLPAVTEETPAWQALPLHLPATTMLDEVVLRTTESGRQWTRHHTGRQHSELSQPFFPSISSLLNPHLSDEANPIATAVSAQVRRTTIQSFAARVAFHYIVSMFLRWYVSPSEDTYQHIPDFMKPTKLQRSVAHPPWVDLFCWPEARDAIIRHMDFSRSDELRLVSSSTVSVNWPYADADIFLSTASEKQPTLNPIFISHIRDGTNWSVGQIVPNNFTFLRGVPLAQGQACMVQS